MPPKKRQHSSNDMNQTYYLPNNVQQPQYTYYPPQERFYNYNYNNASPQHQQTPQLQQPPLVRQQNSPQDQESDTTQGAVLLTSLKETYKPVVKKRKTFQRVFIHRVNPKLKRALSEVESDVRDGEEDIREREVLPCDTAEGRAKEDEDVGRLNDLGVASTKHSNADIIFANGNNREKRRVEMFENYSEMYKFKEKNRESIYKIQRKELKDRLKLLSVPRNPNTEIPELLDAELYEGEQDLVESRDFELTRLKNWRRYRRNENLKNYYKQSNEIYKSTNEALIDKLERLKQFFIKQKNLLNNLDREYTDINSNRAEKFYTGFQQQSPSNSSATFAARSAVTESDLQNRESDHDHLSLPQQQETDHLTQDSSETDTGFTSTNSIRRGPGRRPKVNKIQTQKAKLNNTLMSSIIEGFAPILTHEEFQLVTNDETRSKLNSTINTPANSDTEASKKDGGRTTTSSRAVREARDRDGYKDNNAAMNKIMKHYISPDELAADLIDEDLKLLRSKLGK